jgi:DNA-directed RNA polymerase subunit M/transcription elongation factor TFIIS
MNFCPQCRSVLLPEKRNDTVSFVCVKCGSTSEVSRIVTRRLDKPEQSVFIVEKRQAPQPDQEEEQV